MSYNWNRVGRLSAIGAVCSLAVWFGTSSAKEETSVLVNKTAAPSEAPPSGPALPPPSNPREYRVGGSTDPYVPPLSIPRYTARKVQIPPQELPAPAVPPQELPAPAVPPALDGLAD